MIFKKANETNEVLSSDIQTLVKTSWKRQQWERKVYIVSTLVYGLITLCLLGLLLVNKPRIVLVPPEIKERLSISTNTASEPYSKEMALFLATLVGNLSPKSARYTVDVFSQYLDPAIYNTVKDQLDSVVDMIEKRESATSFFPTRIGHVGNKWYVVGEIRKISKTMGRETITKGEVVTYEMSFKIRDFRLYVTDFRQSTGDTLRKAIKSFREGK